MRLGRQISAEAIGVVYLIHFSGPTSQHRQHYLGWSSDVNRRFERHRSGRGAWETRKATAEGLRLTLAQTWKGTPALEARLKRWSREGRKGFSGLCPFCDGDAVLPKEIARELGAPSLSRRVVPLPERGVVG